MNPALSRVVDTSEDLIVVAGALPNARAGAAALALALGRVAAESGVSLSGLFEVARIAHGGAHGAGSLGELVGRAEDIEEGPLSGPSSARWRS